MALNSGDLWTGGMETTVTTLRWAIIYLIHNPDIQKLVHNEIDKVKWHFIIINIAEQEGNNGFEHLKKNQFSYSILFKYINSDRYSESGNENCVLGRSDCHALYICGHL